MRGKREARKRKQAGERIEDGEAGAGGAEGKEEMGEGRQSPVPEPAFTFVEGPQRPEGLALAGI